MAKRPSPRTQQQITAAIALVRSGKPRQAMSSLKRILQREPGHPDANNVYAMLLSQFGEAEQAMFFAQRAISADPTRVQFLNTLGNLHSQLFHDEEAAVAYRKAIERDATYAPAFGGLASTLCNLRQYEGAIDAARRAISLAPKMAEAHVNLGAALLESARVDEAIEAMREGARQTPDDPRVVDGLVLMLNYTASLTPEQVFADHLKFGALAEQLAAGETPTFDPDSDPDRRLRIGYLSPDFRTHSVAYYVEPLITHHDREQFEIHLFDLGAHADHTTERFRDSADAWHDVAGLNDAALSQAIREQKIDILVELAGLTVGNRVVALARRAAPIQVTYCGYPTTTGIRTIDYRLVDHLTDLPEADRFHVEKLVRLPECFLCYRPVDGMPEPADTPTDRPVTFGSFNALPKISMPVIELWARILDAVPGSTLLLKTRNFVDDDVADRIRGRFAKQGIGDDRLELIAQTPTVEEHLALYGRVDIALDTFPYNGTATTCEALWMGVPVVGMAGRVHAARVGLSLLNAIGHPELIAEDQAGYLRIARDLAHDAAQRAELRSGLRASMAASSLCDPVPFTRHVEEAYRHMWSTRQSGRAGDGGES